MHDIPDELTTEAALPLHLIADLDLESLPARLDDRQWAMVKRIADAPLPSLPPCPERHMLQCLRVMLAVLPRQNSDELTGELFVETYRRQLGEWPADAISYLADQATRQCRWFPTIAECLEIMGGWRRCDADVLRKQKARQLYNEERLARMPKAKSWGDGWTPTADELDAIKAQAAASLDASR